MTASNHVWPLRTSVKRFSRTRHSRKAQDFAAARLLAITYLFVCLLVYFYCIREKNSAVAVWLKYVVRGKFIEGVQEGLPKKIRNEPVWSIRVSDEAMKEKTFQKPVGISKASIWQLFMKIRVKRSYFSRSKQQKYL